GERAAWAGGRAGAGEGEDAADLGNKERARLRKQALAWLMADRDTWHRRVLDGNPRDRADAAAALRHWRRDADLAGVRHPWSLLRLPDEERRGWQKLWADVDALPPGLPLEDYGLGLALCGHGTTEYAGRACRTGL